tara:strand:+ start:2945 stop:4042 length:1098 start_codon:yes stop_codon:yes gene_type:complete
MIYIEQIISLLKKQKIDFFTGVPDSILKNLIFRFKKNHISVNNEGTAVSLASGYYLATGKTPCIYLQNSGLGNAINPIISINNKNVYSIPFVLIIGWRGSPNSNDEPQHQSKGKITREILDLMGIKYCILRNKKDLKSFEKLIKHSKEKSTGIACLIEKSNIKSKTIFNTKKKINNYKILRYDFLNQLVKHVKIKTNIISSTGFISRELDNILINQLYPKINPFYMVGGMGHAASVTLGVSLKSNKENICIDGDGSLLMHTGSLGLIRNFRGKRFKYILLRNDSHESVGGQSTNSSHIDFKLLSKSFGFSSYLLINNKFHLNKVLKRFINMSGSVFLEVRIKSGSIENLGRPKNLKIIKKKFMLG